ncbi:uncharacterized protein LOC135218333 [Macrobrachium nipponense]|uniref:uncharacterized protein LOC135218333 n=1 Tax=Macrobrachium nipponense TaxID=159736 RepID=UPI0030C8C8FA
MKTFALVALGLAALIGYSSAVEEEDNPEVKIFAGYVTRTRFKVLTSSTLLSCISSLNQNAKCGGRRRRSRPSNMEGELSIMEPSIALDGSEGDVSVAKRDVSKQEAKADEDKGKLFVSLTTFTTMTTTSYTANTSTTVSVSFHCIPPDGIKLPYCL